MTSIYDHPVLTPAQHTKRLIEVARAQALLDDWAKYEEENRSHLEALWSRDPRTTPPDPKPIEHGTTRGYSRGCKCQECKRAHADYMRDRNRKLRSLRPPKDPKPIVLTRDPSKYHGTNTGYVYGCRCADCSQAHAICRPKSNTKHGTERAYSDKKCRCRKCVNAMRQRWRIKAARARERKQENAKVSIQLSYETED